MHHLINQFSPVLLDMDRPVDHRGADYNDEGKINTTQTFWGASFQLATFVFITSVKIFSNYVWNIFLHFCSGGTGVTS